MTDPADLPAPFVPRMVNAQVATQLVGLVRRHGPDAVDDACLRALDAEVIDVGLINRMLSRATGKQLPLIPKPPPTASRFLRAGTDFAVRKPS